MADLRMAFKPTVCAPEYRVTSYAWDLGELQSDPESSSKVIYNIGTEILNLK